MERKMGKSRKELLEIKEKFEDFTVDVIKIAGKIKQSNDHVLSEKIQESLKDALKFLTRSTYEEVSEKEKQSLLENFSKELAVLRAFLDVAKGCEYITLEEFETCSKFIEEFEI